MTLKRNFMAAALAGLMALPAAAGDIMVSDAYARSSSPTAKTGAAFLHIMNHGASDDRLVAAASPVAEMVQLHTHEEDANGVMRMMHVEEGFALPAGGMLMLDRGGKHVMFMGLTEPLAQGDMVPLTLVFEKAGEVVIEVPVDLERTGAHGDHSGHGDHGTDHSDGS